MIPLNRQLGTASTPLIIILLYIFWNCSSQEPEGATTSKNQFTIIDSNHSGIEFENKVEESEALNIIKYLYFYNGAGVSSGDINNDGLPDLYFAANQGNDKLYLNKGQMRFKDITESSGIADNQEWSTGVTMADVNGDGWLDIYVCQVAGVPSLQGVNRLYINQQDLTFKEEAAHFGLDFSGLATQSAFFDYDLDGDLDLYLLCHSIHSPENYRPAEIRNDRDSLAGDRLYENRAGKYIEVGTKAGIYSSPVGYGLGLGIADIDGNGYPDIYVGNDFHENDYLYLNQGDGTFTESLESALPYVSQFSMGNDIADVNNDTRYDIITLDMKPEDPGILQRSVGADALDIFQFKVGYGYHYQYPRNMLHINRGVTPDGNMVFSEVGQMAGVAATDWSWSALLADFDNDGWKDLFITNGIERRPNDLDYLKFVSNSVFESGEVSDKDLWSRMPPGKVSNYLYHNKNGLEFEEVTANWGLEQPGLSNGACYADLDNDGDLDLITNNLNQKASIYQNQGHENHYLQIQFRLPGTNIFAIGVEAVVYNEGKVQTQQLQPTRGFMSSTPSQLHFGLGSVAEIDSLTITFENKTRTFYQCQVNTILEITDLDGFVTCSKSSEKKTWFEEFYNDSIPRYVENQYLDTNYEKLLPHLWSRQGPVLTAADLDHDGVEEIFMGGARGRLAFLLDPNGNKLAFQTFQVEAIDYEDTGALFFDANGDSKPDLYVASGGNEYPSGHPMLKDRLYINQGDGTLAEQTSALPDIRENIGPVTAADYDGDQDQDLFVGSQVIHGRYGSTPMSYILENDGTGRFNKLLQVEIPGMITAAKWGDLDGNGRPDLIVAGEWMPITIYYNTDQGFESHALPNSSGWWRSLAVADFDEDGDQDLILGNHGLNSFLKASTEKPLMAYINDFDKNESQETLITYHRDQKEITLATKDQLEAQLPFIRKQFPDYGSFANSSFDHILPMDDYIGTERATAEILGSVYLENNGGRSFKMTSLPPEAQLAPMHCILTEDFNQDGHLDVLMAGNYFHQQISLGRMGASYGALLLGNGKGQFHSVPPSQSGLYLRGEIRDMLLLKNKDNRLTLFAGRNDQIPQLYYIK